MERMENNALMLLINKDITIGLYVQQTARKVRKVSDTRGNRKI